MGEPEADFTPSPRGTVKPLLPGCEEPMVHCPLSRLVRAGILEVPAITNLQDTGGKPAAPRFDHVVPGRYPYDNDVVEIA